MEFRSLSMLDKVRSAVARDRSRIITSSLLVAMLFIVLFIDNFYLAWFVLGVLYAVSVFEISNLYGIRLEFYNVALFVLVWLIAVMPYKAIVGGLFVLCASTIPLFLSSSPRDSDIKNVLPFVYPTLPFLAIMEVYSESVLGIAWLVSLVAISDISAYYGGKLFGKRPLCRVSPKKTLEGAVIGVCSSSLVCGFAGVFVFDDIYVSFISSVFVSLTSVAGDLFESYLKRRASVKDSGSILSGHGGVLDRLDALLYASIAFLLVY